VEVEEEEEENRQGMDDLKKKGKALKNVVDVSCFITSEHGGIRGVRRLKEPEFDPVRADLTNEALDVEADGLARKAALGRGKQAEDSKFGA